jgi:hypothetical protein
MPLLAKLVLALAAVGFLPLVISFLQLRSNELALLEQVQRTHILAAKSTAARVDALLLPILSLARATAAHGTLAGGGAAEDIAEVLRATLEARAEIAGIGLHDGAGETLIAAQRREARDELVRWSQLKETKPALLLRGSRPFLRVRVELADGVVGGAAGAGSHLLVWADASELDEIVQPVELGEEATLVLATRDLEVLVGPPLAEIPAELLEQAQGGKISSSCRAYRHPDGDLVVAFAQLEQAPWFVLSRQPSKVAELARQRIREATWRSAGLAVGLTLLLSMGAFWSVIQPLRRLAGAQRELAGLSGSGSRSEISDLQASFAILQERVRNRQEVGGVFLGRYQISELIGAGAMGSVFRAWDERLRRPVAIKTVHLGSADIDREKLLKSLRDEAAITARIHQPNIVTVYDIEEEGMSAFIAMECVDGINLQTLLDARGKIPAVEAVTLGIGICRGLAAAHQHGLVHHDVKPANILLGRDGSVKLTDFGVSQTITASTRAKNVICGTPGYLAPECFEGGSYVPASDLYALGVVLYECLVGRQPFRGDSLHETVGLTLTHDPEPPATFDLKIPIELSRLVMDLLAKEPSERPSSAGAVVARLEQIAASRGWPWLPPSLHEFQGRGNAGRHGGEATQLLDMTRR